MSAGSPPAFAHPHGTATCSVNLSFSGKRVSGAEVTLELDEERSKEVLTAMQAAPDGSFAPAQRARMAFNLHLVFARLNYLTTVTAIAPGRDTELPLQATKPPEISRSDSGRIRVTATLLRPPAVDAANDRNDSSAAENNLRVHCADPSWYWLVGFSQSDTVSSNRRCVPRLGEAYVFALPGNLPKNDAPSITVNAANTPRSQNVLLSCED